MLQKDEGIVLKTSRSGETSVHATFLGRASGKIRLIAKGALGSKSPWRGVFEAGHHVEVVYYAREGRTLFFVKEASLRTAPMKQRESLPHLATLLGTVELLDNVCYSGGPDAEVVDIVTEFLSVADVPDPLLMFLALEVRLLEALGALPDLETCAACGRVTPSGSYSPEEGAMYCAAHAPAAAFPVCDGVPGLVFEYARAAFAGLCGAEVSRRQRKDLGRLLHWTYTHHVQGYRLPKSLNLI